MRILAAACVLVLASCGATRGSLAWGEGATLQPTRERWLGAARDAALDPWTWAPLAGAGVLSLGNWDEELSDWARRETPVFGSTADARDASDDLRDIARDAWLVSVLATPSGGELEPWMRNKLQGAVVQWGAIATTGALTSLAKSATERERPDASDERSLPSGHSSAAFAYSALARRNVDALDLPEALRWPLRVGLIGVATGTAWARVEAGAHYPTDVLVGAALGNFVAGFVDGAFLGADGPRLRAFADPERGEYVLALAFAW